MNSQLIMRSQRLLCKQSFTALRSTSPSSSSCMLLRANIGAFGDSQRWWRLRQSPRTRRSFPPSMVSQPMILSMAKEEGISEPSSSASKYQVFLSFRGPDTRQGFTDILFETLKDAGVRVFMDDNELRVGHEIGLDLMEAIHDSQIYIPIFSKTYAKSKWCLRELAEMVKATSKSKDKEIIPIFYDVTMGDVKCENGLYDKDVNALGQDGETVEQWKEALRGVCKIKGWGLKDEGQAKFCKSIVREISKKLRVKHKRVTDCLVGMDDQVNALVDLLDMESSGVKAVGIHGMGGIGKTTLAKVVFNQISASFDACSFISDVRKTSDSKGLVHLQKQLLKDLGGKVEIDDEDDGVNSIIALSRKKKVLIVLDDVSQTEQIEKLAGESKWFGSRSRIIITTRDMRNLKIKGQEIKHFEKDELDNKQAFQLFCLHTFGENTAPMDYLPLAKEVVSFTGRLPLTLKIIGLLLNGICEKRFWRNKIEELKFIPPEDVQKKLRISYDSLDSHEKEIFLDIACLFDGEEMTNPIYMWDAFGFFPKTRVDVLVAMSLIKIKDGIFWMHDQVKDLGREIVRAESLEYPDRSRIWEKKEALRILKFVKKGRKKIKAIRLQHDDPFSKEDHTFTPEELGGLERLRFLQLPKYAQISGDLQDCLPNLKWFCLRDSKSVMKVTNFSMNGLVILELTWSNVSEYWDGWNQLKGINALKVLDLTGSKGLRKTPDLSGCNGLERLILNRCNNLIEIDRSIGNLKALKHLDCECCDALRGLPEEICSLEELEQISVESFDRSFYLPESIGCLKSLKILRMHSLSISKLPHSIGDLKSLVELSLDNTDIPELPHTIGGLVNLERLRLRGCTRQVTLPDSVQDLKSLVELDLGESNITNIPDFGGMTRLERLSLYQASSIPASIGHLISLVELSLEGAQVRKLPDSIGNLKLLRMLDIKNSRIRKLPDCIGNLESLETLNIENSQIRKLPGSVEKLKRLKEIDARGSELCEIPIDIGSLPCLHRLDLSATRIRGLPSEMSRLPCLRELWLFCCDELQQLPRLPSSLEALCIKSESLKELPDLSNCSNLIYLSLQGSQLECFNMDWINGCSKLQDLYLRISKLVSPSKWPTRSIELLAPSKLQQLKCFSIDCEELGGNEFQLLLAEMKSLQKLQIFGCNSLERLCNLPKLVHLEELHIENCRNLKEVEGLGEFTSLKKLTILDCKSLKRLIGLSMLEELTCIELVDCIELEMGISPSLLESVRNCSIYGCPHLDSLLPHHLKIKGSPYF